MQFAITQAGDTLEKLTRRSYCVGTDAELKLAMQAMAAANPNLASGASLSAGSLITVPTVEGLTLTGEVQSGSGIAVTLIQSLRQQLVGARADGLGSALTSAIEQQERGARATLELANSREVRNLARTEKLVGERLNDVTKAAENQLERAKTMRELSSKATEELNADLDGLLAMLGGNAAPDPLRAKRE